MKLAFIIGLLGAILTSGHAMTLKEVKDECFKRRTEARQKKDPAAWWALADWVKSLQAEDQPKDIKIELSRQLRGFQEEAILAELPRLAPDDRAGFVALGKKADDLLRSQGSAQASRKVYDAYLRAHPLDEEFYQIYLQNESPNERFSPNEAKSNGLLALLEKNPKIEDVMAAAQWHRSLNEKEYWRAPFRAAFCYVRAIKLAPQAAQYRELLQEHLMRFVSPPSAGQPSVPAKASDGKYQRIDYRPEPAYVRVSPEESQKAKAGTKLAFKVEANGALQYPAAAPATREAVTRVWQLLLARKTSFSGGFVYNDSSNMWAPLQWDNESNAWVLYTKEQERQNVRKNIEFFRENLAQYQKSVKEWEAKSGGAASSGSIVDQFLAALGDSYDSAKVEKVMGDLKFKSAELAGLGNWVPFYRAEIPRLEEVIASLEKELR